MKPRKVYRTRPKKTGARKRQKVLSQKRRLMVVGYKKEELEKLNPVEVRELLKVAMTRKAKRSRERQASGKARTKRKTAVKIKK